MDVILEAKRHEETYGKIVSKVVNKVWLVYIEVNLKEAELHR